MFVLVFLTFTAGVINAKKPLCCKTCMVFNEDDCTGIPKQCESEYEVCANRIEYNIIGDSKKVTISKGCWNDTRVCDQHLILSASTLMMSVYSECCTEDNCNVNTIQMPEPNPTETGKSCPACFIEDSQTCEEITTVKCAGNQGQCANFQGKAARPEEDFKDYAFKGCVTTGTCIVGYGALVGSKAMDPNDLTCSASN